MSLVSLPPLLRWLFYALSLTHPLFVIVISNKQSTSRLFAGGKKNKERHHEQPRKDKEVLKKNKESNQERATGAA